VDEIEVSSKLRGRSKIWGGLGYFGSEWRGSKIKASYSFDSTLEFSSFDTMRVAKDQQDSNCPPLEKALDGNGCRRGPRKCKIHHVSEIGPPLLLLQMAFKRTLRQHSEIRRRIVTVAQSSSPRKLESFQVPDGLAIHDLYSLTYRLQ
jgi:hypothetical protein